MTAEGDPTYDVAMEAICETSDESPAYVDDGVYRWFSSLPLRLPPPAGAPEDCVRELREACRQARAELALEYVPGEPLACIQARTAACRLLEKALDVTHPIQEDGLGGGLVGDWGFRAYRPEAEYAEALSRYRQVYRAIGRGELAGDQREIAAKIREIRTRMRELRAS